MRTIKLFLASFIIAGFMISCTHDDRPDYVECDDTDGPVMEESSADVLLVREFSVAPVHDGEIDDVWAEARPLINKATVTAAGDRIIPLNGSSNGDPSQEPVDLMDPYTGESYKYTLRAGYFGENIYMLFEWEDDTDSKDRESWFFDPVNSVWDQENKYANHKNDKFYEDKFGMMFPIGNPEGFAGGTCTVTCHGNLADPQPGEKVTRHYMKNQGELVDFWHWKRDRHALAEACDDGFVQWEEDEGMASANGRKNDDGISPYSANVKFTDPVTELEGPLYVIPGRENYYWITQDEIDNGVAKEVTGVAADGVLTYDGGTIDPNGDPAYSQGFGNKRMPSIIINPAGQGNDGRSEVRIKSKHIGTGWQLEIMRKLDTGDPFDTPFVVGTEIPFGLCIFNNAAIAHGQTNFLTMTIE